MVGLGRMGGNIVRRLLRAGHDCVVWDRDPAPGAALATEGARAVAGLAAMVAGLDAPRTIWVMLPSGAATEDALREIAALLSPGDVLIDGGNSMWKDSQRRGAEIRARGLHFLDIGTSGGVWGLARGYSLMIGGEEAVVRRLDPIFRALVPGKAAAEPSPGAEGRDPRPAEGYVHCGANGAGHFTKMIHNGIEYGMMQAMAEGLDILHHQGVVTASLADVTEGWRRGSVVASWLLDLTAQALAAEEHLGSYSGTVSDSGEGRWTVDAAVEQGVAAPVLAAALFARFTSRDEQRFSMKALSAMRKGFGGHLEPPKPPSDGRKA
jgi:6-phosphogluconate dehydrogenase